MTTLRLVIANVAIFLALKIVWLIAPGMIDATVEALALPPDPVQVCTSPWTPFTYMFLHINFWHLLVNAMWLSFFGVLLERTAGRNCMLISYIAGGLAGSASYIAYASAMPHSQAMLAGASAATLSVITTALIAAPDKRLAIALAGTVRLKWLAAAGLIVFLCASFGMTAPQAAAHFGGITAGAAVALLWRYHSRKNMEIMKTMAKERMMQLSLVEKARRSGYASLSPDERIRLFNLSDSTRKPPCGIQQQ